MNTDPDCAHCGHSRAVHCMTFGCGECVGHVAVGVACLCPGYAGALPSPASLREAGNAEVARLITRSYFGGDVE